MSEMLSLIYSYESLLYIDPLSADLLGCFFVGAIILSRIAKREKTFSKAESIEAINNESELTKIETTQPEKKIADIKLLKEQVVEGSKESRKVVRSGLFASLKALLTGKEIISAETIEELEMLLISADLGVATVAELINDLKQSVKNNENINEDILVNILKEKIKNILKSDVQRDFLTGHVSTPVIVMVVGINGVGKTTTIAKLANLISKQGKKVMLAAGDTFRAAAVEQLKIWGERLQIPVVAITDGKPSAVVFEAIKEAKDNNIDVLIIDTAGRLHNKSNLMQELEGIKNVIKKYDPSAPHEVLLVIDGSTGQNGLIQAQEFHQTTSLTGLVVTKLDGTPKGGIVVAIKNNLNIPIRFVGVGEGLNDLLQFSADDFTESLFSEGVQEVKVSEHAGTRRRRREEAA